jgi:hypothetical protein
LSKTTQTAKLKSGLLISVIGTESDYLAQWNLSVREKFTVLAMNQILPTNFLNEAGLNSTSRSRPTMNSLAKRCQPAEPLKMGIANRDGIAARKEGSGKRGSRIGRFQAKRMKAVVEKQSKGKPHSSMREDGG